MTEQGEPYELEDILGIVWDSGNVMGLDGWIGPGRGAGEVDDEAVHNRERDIQQAVLAIRGAGYKRNL